jgi:hypothetical protein
VKFSPHVRLASLTVGLAVLQPTFADLITIPPGNVTASSEIGAPFNRQDDFIVDASGLVGGQHTPAVEPNMWLSTGTAFGGADPDPFVIFDLGEVFTITSIRVWNYNESPPNLTTRGVNAVSVEYGTTAALGSVLPGITSFRQADGLATYAGEVFDSFVPFTAQFVKFDINSNHGGDNNFYGLSEVQFDGVPGGLGLSPSSFSTAATQGDPVGTLSTPAVNPGDTFTYALIAGAGDDDNDKFQIVEDELQIGAHDFSTAAGQMFSIRVRSTGAPSGARVERSLTVTAVAPDLTGPMVLTLSPADDSIDGSVTDKLVVTFDEPVVTGTGNITINNLSDLTQTVIPVADAQISISGAILTIDPTTDLIAEKNYAVQIDATAIDDISGNNFAGIADDTTWNFTIPAAPPITLVGYWPFDSDSDPQPDLSEFGNAASVNGAGTWANDAVRNSGVMQFVSGVGLQAAHSESLNITGPITIAAWVKPTAGAWEGIVAKSPAGTLQNFPGNYEFRLHTTGRHMEMLWESAPGALAAVSDMGTGISDNVWTHVAFTGTPGGLYTFYVNGIATGTGAMPANFNGQNTNPLYIGSRADAFTGFDGCLDDVALFDGQLPPQQIPEIMNGNFSAFGIGGNDFRITDIVFDRAVPSVTFTFNSRPGQRYVIEASTQLDEKETAGGWFELDDSFASQGSETTYVDTFAVAAPNLTQIYYRVKKAP